MASLGEVCAVGIAANMLISIFLLPVWWRTVVGRGLKVEGQRKRRDAQTSRFEAQGSPLKAAPPAPRPPPVAPPSPPSSLYRPSLWRLGLGLVRLLPPKLCARLSRVAADVYWFLARHRQAVVIQNLCRFWIRTATRRSERPGCSFISSPSS